MSNPVLPISSPDISALSYKVLYDLSGAIPTIVLTNLSTVINPNSLTWWYVITTPAGIPIHAGSATSPDVNHTAWTTLQIPNFAWTTPFGNPPCGQVEFGADVPYICTLYVKDSLSNTYQLAILQTITRPNGNSQNSCGNFGRAVVNLEVKCNENPAMVYCNVNTNLAYNNKIIPDVQTSEWILTYPPDSQGNQPSNAVATNTPSVKFPVSYSGDGYVIFFNNFCTYDMGNGATIKLQYKAINPKTGSGGISFAVLCNVNLCKLSCQIQEFYNLSKKKCGDLEIAGLNVKMTQMNLLLNQAIIGVFFPLCGIDVPALILQIQAIGDLDANCDCGCGDSGVNFSYPTSANPSGGGGCCPVSSNVIDIDTDIAPALCPASYFPVNVYDPTGVTQIGVAYEVNGLVSILNSYPAWAAYGVAFAQGNCKIGWFPANSGTTIPDVKVDVIADTNGNGNNGTGGGTGGGTFQVDVYLRGTGGPPPPCPGSFYPANVWNYGNTAIIGVANNPVDLVSILNADSSWNTFGTYSVSANCFAQLRLNDPNNIPTNRIFVSLIDVTNGASTVNKKIVTHGTSTYPTLCPASFYPAKIYNAGGTAIIGIANNITDVCALLNSDSSWNTYGTAAPLDNCNVTWALTLSSNIPPDIQVDTNVTGTGCVNGAQTYQIIMSDLCVTGGAVTLSSYPLNLYVDFGLGVGQQFVGNFATQALGVVGLNAVSGKPASVTFTAGPTVDKIIATNTNCDAYNNAIAITTDAGSSSYLLHGANHSNLNGATPTRNGYFGTTLKTNTMLGRLAGAVNSDFRFHVIKLANGDTVHLESNTGKVYFYTNANPNTPFLYSTVQLSTIDSNNFTGLPHSPYKYGSASTASFYSLYCPTDYFGSGMYLNHVFVFEATTGSAWQITSTGVVTAFKDARLKGKCPRVMYNDIVYFTQDGDLETYVGSSGVLVGAIVKLDTTNFSAGGLSTQTLITNLLDELWSATYDGAGFIYFSGKYSSIVKYNVASQSVTHIDMYVLPGFGIGLAQYYGRLNSVYFMGEIYHTPAYALSHFMPIINPSTLAVRDVLSQPAWPTARTLYNFLPLGNCLGILTYNGSDTASPASGPRGAMAIYKLDGTYICDIDLGGAVDMYNVVAFGNQSTFLPNYFNF